MKVLLKVDVDNLGMAGEVQSVSNGYGRNYLIPQGLAVVASPSMMKQAEVWRKKAEARRQQIRAEYEALAELIRGVHLTFSARAGESGKLYGSITTSQIADEMNEVLGTDIDRRKVGVEPLRQLGKHKVVVRLSGDFQPELTVVVESEADEETAAAKTDEAEVKAAVAEVVEEAEAVEAES